MNSFVLLLSQEQEQRLQPLEDEQKALNRN